MTAAEQMREDAAKVVDRAGSSYLNEYAAAELAAAIRALPLPPEPPIIAELEKALAALKPFADRVFNDNGECTVSDTYLLLHGDFVAAYFAERTALASLATYRGKA